MSRYPDRIKHDVCCTLLTGAFAFSFGALLSGCAQLDIVDARSTVGDRKEGKILPLENFLAKDGAHTKLILIHGMGIHTSGYGVDENSGESWLNEKTLAKLHMKADDSYENSPAVLFEPSEFVPNYGSYQKSGVILRKREYTYKASNAQEYKIDAIEITWSPLPLWLKNKLLCYDVNKVDLNAGNDANTKEPLDCPALDELGRPYVPPPRTLINGLIKNSVFDRALADAILYMGPYKYEILRGVSWALCQGLSPVRQPPGKNGDLTACTWPDASTDENRYIFVTHSLGSRIAYDMVLGLQGEEEFPTEVYSDAEIKHTAEFMTSLNGKTSVMYMMANQLPLLGMANVPAVPDPGVHSYDIDENKIRRAPGRKDTGRKAPTSRWSSLTEAFSRIRYEARGGDNNPRKSGDQMYVVAFSDTNDLLTWPLPPWYTDKKEDAPQFIVTNVFVHNSTNVVGLFERPDKAHGGYFENQDVWDVIRCGHAAAAACP